jgi:hypothetical protein
MCYYKIMDVVVNTMHFVKMLNNNKKKKAWRNSWVHLDWSE